MEYFVLGLLMLHKFTAYEIHINIKNNFQSICSDSIGNIQRALKKLAAAGSVTYVSVVENEVNKKVYTITPKGRQVFLEWLDNTIGITKVKNMEISRLLLLGFLDTERQMTRIDETISMIEEEYEYLKKIVEEREELVAQLDNENDNIVNVYLSQVLKRGDEEFLEELIESTPVENVKELLKSVDKFGYLTLQLGLDETKFYLDWFKNLKRNMENERKSNS
jgi:DNA-binding PadR family transcriptional regulator